MNGDPYVMPHERRILTIRQHPLTVLWKPAAAVISLFAFAVFASATGGGTAFPEVAWLGLAAGLGYFAWKALEWSMTYLILTNLRMVVVTGVLTRNVSMIPLVKVVDMNFQRPLLGMALGYGRLVVEGAHDAHPLRRLGPLPQIDMVYSVICGMIFSDPEDRGE